MEYYTSDVSGKRAALLDRACGEGARMRSPLAIGTAVALLLAPAVGCRKPEPKDVGEVRVAYLQIIPSLPVFIAQEQQLFDKANLRLKTVVLSSSNDVVNAMVAGQADILPAVSLVPILHLEIQSPGRVRLFSHSRMNENNALDKIIVRGSSPLQSIKDLAGKKMGVFPGTAPSLMLAAFLKNHGVDPATVKMLQLPPQAQIASLESGAVDAIYAYEPVTTTALAHGGYRRLFGSVYADLLNPCPVGASLVSREFERKHPERAARAVRAVQQSLDFMAAHPVESRALLPKYLKLTPEIAARVNFADVTLSNQVDVGNIQQFIDLLHRIGEIPERIDAHRLVDPTR
jgi:ABC-type nitrate/sulfonate/bicarbonate transport system substrate-binding protein